jgi:hypothetical protein
MIASGKGGMGCPPIERPLAEIIYRKGHLIPLPTQNGQSPVGVKTQYPDLRKEMLFAIDG